jgi:hypothetical protein
VVAQAGQGPWQPRGSGLLVAVVALSVVALLAHGAIALVLLSGTVRPPVSSNRPVGRPTTPVTTPRPTVTATSTSTGNSSPTTGTPSTAPAAAGALHLDHACLVADNPPTSAHIPPGDPFGSDLAHLGSGVELQRLYVVRNGTLEPADSAGPVRECDRQLWGIVVAATPAEVLRYVDELLVFDADLSGGSGAGEVFAQPNSTEASAHWRLSLALNVLTDLDVTFNVAHEVGHLLSLNRAEMTGQDESSCQGIFMEEGCLRDEAALPTFVDDTWDDDLLDEWSTADDITDDQQRADALDAFYQKHHDRFVDSYAATHPVEDFAESFAMWCALGPSSPLLPDFIEGDPKDGAAKLAWFDDPAHAVGGQARARCEALQAFTR